MPIINPLSERVPGAADPLLFMAGPIQGAPDYQTRFAGAVLERRPDFVVATPRVPEELERRSFDYDRQVDWEERHLWLPRSSVVSHSRGGGRCASSVARKRARSYPTMIDVPPPGAPGTPQVVPAYSASHAVVQCR